MKFPLLPLGARFQFQGRVYVKTGPLLGTPEDGGETRVIPRWAVLQPVGEAARPAAPPPADQPLEAAQVMAAFDEYHARCVQLLADAPVERRQALEEARRAFLERLNPS